MKRLDISVPSCRLFASIRLISKLFISKNYLFRIQFEEKNHYSCIPTLSHIQGLLRSLPICKLLVTQKITEVLHFAFQ